VIFKQSPIAKAVLPLIAFFLFTSSEWATTFADAGITVIDNSSAWGMDISKPLVVPEINADVLTLNDKIIANPNCSKILIVMEMIPPHKNFLKVK
jgi:aspartate-semialdehyde dehydrogenase